MQKQKMKPNGFYMLDTYQPYLNYMIEKSSKNLANYWTVCIMTNGNLSKTKPYRSYSMVPCEKTALVFINNANEIDKQIERYE
jgi:predicted ester cyclase